MTETSKADSAHTSGTRISTNAWFNGDITPRETGAPSIASINLHIGTSVFDGIMAYLNDDHYHVLRAEAHLHRFREGAARMGLEIPWTVAELARGILDLLETEPKGTQYIRPIAYRRAPDLWLTGSERQPVDVSIFTVKVDRQIDMRMSCHISTVERISSRAIPRQIKVSGAYVNSYNVRRTAELAGFNDGIMLDTEGRLAEASAANVFVLVGDQLITPPLNPDVFPGITRQVVLEIATGAGIEVSQADLLPSDLGRVTGAFLCSTLMEIRPISLLDATPLDTQQHPVYRYILQSFRDIIST